MLIARRGFDLSLTPVFSQTGKDDYANARNKMALKDGSYKSVASAQAEAHVLDSFIHATEVVEADTWAAELEGRTDTSSVSRAVSLLAPTEYMVASAQSYVEEVKEDFAKLVMHCFIEDCPLGKGFYRTTAGPKCNSCKVGETWSGATDALPCAEVLATCERGEGYTPSTSEQDDASCAICTSSTFSAAKDANPCTAFAVVSCPAGQELTPGTATADGTCTACADGMFKAGAGSAECSPFSVVVCGAGQESASGSSIADTHCVSCPAGTFSLGGGAGCGPHGSTNCGPGYQHVPGSGSSDHSCEACPTGRFKSGTSSSNCAAIGISTCPAGKELTPGSSVTDGRCTDCRDGHQKTAAGSGRCTVIPGPRPYRRIHKGCVGGHNMFKRKHKTVLECRQICDDTPGCIAFEYGVNYRGRGGYRSGDCQPQNSYRERRDRTCNGGHYNLDLYVPEAFYG